MAVVYVVALRWFAKVKVRHAATGSSLRSDRDAA